MLLNCSRGASDACFTFVAGLVIGGAIVFCALTGFFVAELFTLFPKKPFGNPEKGSRLSAANALTDANDNPNNNNDVFMASSIIRTLYDE